VTEEKEATQRKISLPVIGFKWCEVHCICCVTASIDLPTNWSSMNDGDVVRLVDIPKDKPEYTKVEKEFLRTANNTVQGVIKVRCACMCACAHGCVCVGAWEYF